MSAICHFSSISLNANRPPRLNPTLDSGLSPLILSIRSVFRGIQIETGAIQADLQTKLKRSAASASSMKSDIVKGQETLEEHQKYAAFLEIMILDGVEDPSQFFDVPQKTIDFLEKMRWRTFS
jgi:hypothetical protein